MSRGVLLCPRTGKPELSRDLVRPIRVGPVRELDADELVHAWGERLISLDGEFLVPRVAGGAPVDVEQFATLAESTLSSSMTNVTTTAPITLRDKFPQASSFNILVQASETDETNREIMRVTAGAGTGAGSFTVTRGVEGTTAVAHNSGEYVAFVLTAAAQYRWVPSYVRQPRHSKLVAWSFPPEQAAASSATTLVTLRPFVQRIYIPETVTLNNMLVSVFTAGATLTAGSNLGAFYNSTGVRQATTATQASTWTSTGLKTMALTIDAGKSLTVVGGPDVYIYACILTAGTTLPAFARGTIQASPNAGLTVGTDNAYAGQLVAVTAGNGPPTSFTPTSGVSEIGTAPPATPLLWIAFS